VLQRWLFWPLFAAIMGFALGGSVFWGLYGPNTTIEQADAAYEQRTSQHEAKSKKEETDEALARYTFWLTGFTGVLALATIGLGSATLGLYLTGEKQVRFTQSNFAAQSRQTQASIEVSERAFVAGERAWIRVDVRNNGSLVFDGNGNARINLLFTLTNTGNSPATKVRIHTHVFLGNVVNFTESTPRDEYLNICEVVRMRGEMPIDEMLSYTLFPGETKEHPYFVMISRQQLDELMQRWKKRTGQDELKHFSPHIVGCVSYSIPFDDRQHQTGFMYELKRRLPGVPETLQWGMFNIDDQVVDTNDVRLFHSVWGSPTIN
jgi:hypothetical protein